MFEGEEEKRLYKWMGEDDTTREGGPCVSEEGGVRFRLIGREP
jgi:hypothetical protein